MNEMYVIRMQDYILTLEVIDDYIVKQLISGNPEVKERVIRSAFEMTKWHDLCEFDIIYANYVESYGFNVMIGWNSLELRNIYEIPA